MKQIFASLLIQTLKLIYREDLCFLTCTNATYLIKKQVCRGSKAVKVTCVTADVLNSLKVKTVEVCQYFTGRED